MLGAGGAQQVGLRDRLAGLQIRGAPCSRVAGDRARGVLDAESHRQVGERCQLEFDGVRDLGRPRGNDHRRLPTESQGLAALGADRGPAVWRGHLRREDRQGLRTEGIGEPDSQAPAAQRDVDHLSERGVGQARDGWHVGWLGPLGVGRPGTDPVTFVAPRAGPGSGNERQGQQSRRSEVSQAFCHRWTRVITCRRSRCSPEHPGAGYSGRRRRGKSVSSGRWWGHLCRLSSSAAREDGLLAWERPRDWEEDVTNARGYTTRGRKARRRSRYSSSESLPSRTVVPSSIRSSFCGYVEKIRFSRSLGDVNSAASRRSRPDAERSSAASRDGSRAGSRAWASNCRAAAAMAFVRMARSQASHSPSVRPLNCSLLSWACVIAGWTMSEASSLERRRGPI